MDYKTTLRVGMMSFPSIFLDEADFLHHVFFVLGNGYDWKNGELVSDEGDPEEIIRKSREDCLRFYKQMQEEERKRPIIRIEGPDEFRKEMEEMRRFMTDYWGEHIARHEAGSEVEREHHRKCRTSLVQEGEADDCWFLLPDGRIGRVLYPISAPAAILHIPEDVKPDWLDAARRAIELALSDLFRRTPEDEVQLLLAVSQLRTLQDPKAFL